MANFMKRAQLYLGLGPDDEYEEYEEYEEAPAQPASRPARESVAPPSAVRATRPSASATVTARPAPPAARPAPPAVAEARPAPPSARPAPPPPAVRPAPPSKRPAPPPPAARPTREAPTRSRPAPPPPPEPVHEGSAVRTLPPTGRGGDAPPPPKARPVVRPVAANAKPSVIAPRSFNHAQEVADRFKASQPVILNLQGVEKDLSRRLLDFCSGICYALGGHMEKVAARVYLLTPSNVEVSAEERRRLQERGLYDV